MLDLIVDLALIVSVGLPGLAMPVRLRGVRVHLVETLVEYIARFTDVIADLHGRRLIDGETWTIWRRRIAELVRPPLGPDLWQLLRPEYGYFSEFVEFVDTLATAWSPGAGTVEPRGLTDGAA